MEEIDKSIEELNAELEQRKKVLEFQKQAFKKILEGMNERMYKNEKYIIKKEND